MPLPISSISQDFFEIYNSTKLNSNGYVCQNIQGSVRALPWPGQLHHEKLVKYLNPCGYNVITTIYLD